jgi:hypothetical protein
VYTLSYTPLIPTPLVHSSPTLLSYTALLLSLSPTLLSHSLLHPHRLTKLDLSLRDLGPADLLLLSSCLRCNDELMELDLSGEEERVGGEDERIVPTRTVNHPPPASPIDNTTAHSLLLSPLPFAHRLIASSPHRHSRDRQPPLRFGAGARPAAHSADRRNGQR